MIDALAGSTGDHSVSDAAESDSAPPGPIGRVRRPKSAARDWYNALSPWYEALANPFEATARSAGLELLDAGPGDRVLDVGCGPGTALVDLARAVGSDGTAAGLDLSPGMCQEARRALADAGLEAGTVVAGDGAVTPFRDGAFDAVFVSFVLELFDSPELPSVLAEWRRLLEPSGRLVVVALSRRRPGPATRLYETVRELAPTYADCRPIYLRETLLEADFQIEAERLETVWQFPVEIVRCRPA